MMADKQIKIKWMHLLKRKSKERDMALGKCRMPKSHEQEPGDSILERAARESEALSDREEEEKKSNRAPDFLDPNASK